jgi:hypothetical protein
VTKPKAREGMSTYEEAALARPPEANDGSPRFEAPAPDREFLSHIEAKRLAMKASLEAQPQVQIMLPARSSSGDERACPVTLNGYRLVIQRGVQVSVPAQVAEILRDADVW